MATIGQALTAPEAGWRRIDDKDQNITYIGVWGSNVLAGGWLSTQTYSNIAATKIRFNFTGTSFRFIGSTYDTRTTTADVYIDGIKMTTINQYGTPLNQILQYSVSNLTNKEHYVEIINNATGGYGGYFSIDALDIGSADYLRPYNENPKQKVCSKIEDMQIGDIIPCRYTATTANVAGYFSELGTCIADEIPITGTTTPNGLFYFIKNEKGMLIADRVVQTGISWDTLNTVGYVEGKGTVLFDSPTMTSAVFPYGKVTCSTYHTGAYPYDGWRCFNPNPKNQGDSWQVKGSDPCWLAYDWTEPKLVNSYGFTPNSLDPASVTCAPKTFRFEGSADSTNWVVLDRRVDETSWVMNQFKYFTFTNDTPYRYYRLYIESNNGGGFTIVFQFCMGIRKVCKIRSLTGGNAYLSTDGKASFVDKGLGAWPPNNEWDRYIVKSDLGGKIVAGDDAVWHRNINAGFARTWCSDTMINGIVTSAGTAGPGLRVYRAYFDNNPNSMACFPSGSIDSRFGFRPVLEYPEDPRCTNIWY